MYIFNLVGAKFRSSAAQAQVLALKQGDQLILEREPNNEFDSNAIKVLSFLGYHIGYVPKHVAPTLAQFMDEGCVLICKVRHTSGNQPILAVGTEKEVNDLAPPPIPLKEALQHSLDDEVPF
jgi:hypothetical protein